MVICLCDSQMRKKQVNAIKTKNKLKNFVDKKALIKVANSIFTSKIRYDLELIGKTRWNVQDTPQQDLQAIQLAQNKLVRQLNGTKISDKINTKKYCDLCIVKNVCQHYFLCSNCSVERTTLQPIHKEIVHQKITDLILFFF